VPVNSGLEKEFEVAYKAIPEQQLLDMLAGVGVDTGIVVLDACRTNDLRHVDKSGAKGLARNAGARGVLLAYAAEPGQVALDSASGSSVPLSPYARRLAENLAVPGKPLTDVFLETDAQVAADTQGRQRPEAVMRLNHNLVLAGLSAPTPVSAAGHSSSSARQDFAATPAPVSPTPSASPDGPRTPAQMNERGDDYYYGRNGFPQNDAEAVRWFKKAAEQGDAAGQDNLGYMYEHGRGGLARSDAEAVRWYREAATQGHANAQNNLGVMYRDGRGGLAQDAAEAVRWFTKAARQGNAAAESSLGFMYAAGEGGLVRDDTEAVRWLTKSAEQADSSGRTNLAFMYEYGRGGLAKNETEAIRLYTLAARQGNVHAQERLKARGLTW
jgi:hypothetical protein